MSFPSSSSSFFVSFDYVSIIHILLNVCVCSLLFLNWTWISASVLYVSPSTFIILFRFYDFRYVNPRFCSGSVKDVIFFYFPLLSPFNHISFFHFLFRFCDLRYVNPGFCSGCVNYVILFYFPNSCHFNYIGLFLFLFWFSDLRYVHPAFCKRWFM